jgi:cell division protein FtsZ
MSGLHEFLKNADKIKLSPKKSIDLYVRINKIKKSAKKWLNGLEKNGFDHSERLEAYLDSLTLDLRKAKKINSAEIFILLCAIYMHDIGYNLNGKNISKDHAKRTQEMILSNPSNYQLGDFPPFDGSVSRIAEAVSLVCFGHKIDITNDSLDKIPDDFKDFIFGNESLNLRMLTALLRLADETDDPYIRFSPSSQSIRNKIPLVQIKDNTIIWHWDKTREKDPSIFKSYLEEKILTLESSLSYLRSVGAGEWFVVLQPQVSQISQSPSISHDSSSRRKPEKTEKDLISLNLKILEKSRHKNLKKIDPQDRIKIQEKLASENNFIASELSGIPRVVIIGCGGAGSNTINRIFHMGVFGAETIAIHTKKKHFDKICANKRIFIGKTLTRGIGSGGNPEIGKLATENARPTLETILDSADLVFITAGMGGGTGSGSTPIVARIAKAEGALVIGIVSYPFLVEKGRLKRADEGIKELRSAADCVIVLDNNRLKHIVPNLPLNQAFSVMDQIICETIKNISEAITQPGLINIGLSDLRTIMSKGGIATLLTGETINRNRVEKIIRECKSDSISDIDYHNATGCFIQITGGPDLTLEDAEKIASGLTADIDPEADVIWGVSVRNDLQEKVHVLAIMTGIKKEI